MISWRSLAIVAACTTAALPALAGPPGPPPGPPPPGLTPPPTKNGGQSIGAPGPIAGAGLPILLVAGGYFLVRRYRNKSKVE
jgi:hypothetical protein